jgi:hypothetical protein
MAAVRGRLRSAFLQLGFAAIVGALSGVAYSASALPEGVAAAIETIDAEDLQAHLRFLASDELKGRGTGHEGNAVAAMYLASFFERLQLGRAGAAYLQPVALYFSTLGPRNELAISEQVDGADVTTRYTAGADFYPHPSSAARDVSAELVFAGFGITAPDLEYDDYAGLEARGRIVIAFEGEPQSSDERSRFQRRASTKYAGAEHKLANAKAHGAAGLLLVRTRMRDVTSVWPADPAVRNREFQIAERADREWLPVGLISARAADALLASPTSGETRQISALRKQIDETLERAQAAAVNGAASFAVPGRKARLSIDLNRQSVIVHNVLGVLEGADPELKHEIVVVGAHMDHDGVDADGRVYNGADDNGSGTVGVLETAEAFAVAARNGRKPARTVVFALWNGEEKGYLGSVHYADHPSPAGRIVANVNLDMVGRDEDVPDPSDFRFFGLPKTSAAQNRNTMHLLGYSYSPELAAIVREENAAIGLTIKETLDVNPQNLIKRSDQWTFLQRRIPAVFFTTGLHPDYHTPQDDVGRINFEKLVKIARLAFRVSWRLASDQPVPAYVEPRHAARATQLEP